MKRLPPYPTYLILEGLTALLFGMIFTASSIYQVTLAHLSPLQLVLVGTTVELSVFIFEVPTGVVADAYSRRLSILIGVILTGIAFLVEGAFPVFGTILVAQVLWGLGFTFTSGATQAWITDEIGEAAAGQAFLRASQVGSLAALAGVGAGMLLGSLRINLPILAGGACFLALGLFLALAMPETGFHPIPRAERNSWQHMLHIFREGMRMIRRRPALLTILGIGLFYGLYSEGFDRLWTKLVLDGMALPAFGTPVLWLGLLRGIAMVCSVAATEWVRRKLDVSNSQVSARALLVCTGILIAGLVGFAWSPLFALAAVIFIAIAVTRDVVGPIYQAWVNQRLDSSVRATVLSMSSQVDAIGQTIGGPFVGVIGNLSVRAAITVSGLLLTPALWLGNRARRAEPVGARSE